MYWLYSKTENGPQAFVAGLLFALGYFVTGLWWIGNALLVEGNEFAWVWPISVIGLPTLLGLFTGTYLAMARMSANPKTLGGFFAFAFFLTLSEWARGHAFTGFPWNLYGYVWSDHIEMAQIAHYVGAFGLTFISLLWASSPEFIRCAQISRVQKLAVFALVALSMAGTYCYGALRLQNNPTSFDTKNAVAVIQPNIPQNMKWDPVATQDNFVKTVSLSRGGANSITAENTFIVWPETAISPAIYTLPENMQMISDMLATYKNTNPYFITGVLRRNVEGDTITYANSIAYMDRDLKPLAFYDKFHLVPFGEFIPFQDWIPLKPVAAFKGFQRGNGAETIEYADTPSFSPLICYEVIFADDVTDKSGKRPRWIVNVTNDGWYGDSAGPHQHFAQTRMRAIEEGIPVIRSANTGISGIFDSYGRTIDSANIFDEAVLVTHLPLPIDGKNPWWPWGFQWLFLLIGLPLMARLFFRSA